MPTNQMPQATFGFTSALKFARDFYADAKAELEAENESYREQGYRNQYCIHGTNQWTDYDNICGGCEDGVTLLHMCVSRAVALVRQANERLYWLSSCPGGVGYLALPVDVQKTMWEWVFEGWPEAH